MDDQREAKLQAYNQSTARHKGRKPGAKDKVPGSRVPHPNNFARKIDKTKAIELKTRGLGDGEIATFFGVSRSTVSRTLRKYGKYLIPSQDLSILDANKTALLQAAQMRAIPYILEPGKLEKASWLQLVTGLGILIDKQRLLDGQSTTNIAVLDVFKAVREWKRQQESPPAVQAIDTTHDIEATSDNGHYVNFSQGQEPGPCQGQGQGTGVGGGGLFEAAPNGVTASNG